MKVFIVGGDRDLVNFLPDAEVTDNVKEAKVVIFGDGPIVSPSLYKEKKHPEVKLKCDINRDRADKAIYTKLKPDQIAIGIGRGACFLAVMNNAKLIQHTTKKGFDKASYMVHGHNKGKEFIFPAISNWTQSINVKDCEEKDYQCYMYSKNVMEYFTDRETAQFMKKNGDPELIKFCRAHQPISFCIQYHPEWLPESFLSKITKDLIYEYANS